MVAATGSGTPSWGCFWHCVVLIRIARSIVSDTTHYKKSGMNTGSPVVSGFTALDTCACAVRVRPPGAWARKGALRPPGPCAGS
jgi:hypothetical protein